MLKGSAVQQQQNNNNLKLTFIVYSFNFIHVTINNTMQSAGCRSIQYYANKIPAHRRLKITQYIRTRQKQQMFGVIPFVKLQNDTLTTAKL